MSPRKEAASTLIPSVFVAAPDGNAWTMIAGPEFPKQALVYVEKDILVQRSIGIGTLKDNTFTPFKAKSTRELSQNAGRIEFENGVKQTTALFQENGSHFLLHHYTVPQQAISPGGDITLTLPIRITPIQAMQYNVLQAASERFIRGPQVAIHLPYQDQDSHFFGFSGENGHSIGTLVQGAESVTLTKIPDQKKPIKDFYITIHPHKTSTETYEFSLITHHDKAPISHIKKKLSDVSVDEIQGHTDLEWNTRRENLPHMEFEGEDPNLSHLVRMYNAAQISLLKLHNTVGEGPEQGIMAGPKWPSQQYGRDTAISIPGLLAAGLTKEVKESLETLLSYQKKYSTKFDRWFRVVAKNKFVKDHLEAWGVTTPPGKIPHRIDRTGADFTSIDSTALLISAVKEYVTTTGDLTFLDQHKQNLYAAHSAMNVITNRDNLPRAGFAISRHGPLHVGQTWKDVDMRWGVATEVACQYEKAYRDISSLFTLLGDEKSATKAYEKSVSMKKKIAGLKDENGYPDSVMWIGGKRQDNRRNTIESLIFPYLLGTDHLDSKSLTQVLEGLSTLAVPGVGIRAVEPGVKTKREQFFEKLITGISQKKNAYHGEASTWPFNTALVSQFLLESGETEKGLILLHTVASQLNSATLNGIPETMNLDGKPSHECPIQTWSIATPTEVFYRQVLGIHIDQTDTEPFFSVNPLNLSQYYKGPFRLAIDNISLRGGKVRIEYTEKGYTIQRIDTSPSIVTFHFNGDNFNLYKNKSIMISYP